MIGLCGAHRVGKTTLAKLYSESSKVPLLATSASAVFESMGLSPKLEYPFEVRLAIQENLLIHLDSLYRQHEGAFVTDRTPIDLMGYTLADIARANVPGSLSDRVDDYVTRCYEVLNRNFSVVCLIQPGITILDAEGKAPAHKAYIEHLNDLMMGLMVSEKTACAHFYIPRKTLDMASRISCLNWAVNTTVKRHQEVKAQEGFALH